MPLAGPGAGSGYKSGYREDHAGSRLKRGVEKVSSEGKGHRIIEAKRIEVALEC